MTATQLRANLYRTLDRVLETGEAVEIERNGRIVRIVAAPAPKVFHWDDLVARPNVINGDPDDIVHMDWYGEWKP